jgi:ribosomal protein S18 acetylase RimI-like enzyme
MHRPFRIRPATASDIANVRTLFRAYASALGVDLSYQGFEQEIANLPGAYAPPAGILLLARATNDGEAVGCVAVRPFAEAATCEMKRLYTSPAARGAGLGRALAEAAIAAATRAGYRAMRLDTLPTMTTAQSLYRLLGFELTPPYYATPVDGTIFMRKTLIQPRTSPE